MKNSAVKPSARTAALLRLVWLSMRILGRRGNRSDTVILAPAVPGSLGDHVMLTVLCEQIVGPKVLLSLGNVADRREMMPDTSVVRIGGLFSSSLARSAAAAVRVGRVLVRARAFIVIGADIMDGGYSPWRSEMRFGLATLAARSAGAATDASVINMSWNGKPSPRAIAALRRADGVRIVARDAASAARLRCNTDANIDESADLGFLYTAVARPEQGLVDWLEAEGEAGRRVVAVNLNAAVASGERLLDLVLPACEWACDNGYSLLLVSHDDRNGEAGDLALLRTLRDRLGATRSTYLWQPTGADEVTWALRSTVFVVSCRMHLVVLASAAGVPPIAFEYQDKLTGLYERLGLPDLVLEIPGLRPDQVDAKVRWLAAHRDSVASDLSARLPSLQAQARRNWHE